jgi:hypothetical protein
MKGRRFFMLKKSVLIVAAMIIMMASVTSHAVTIVTSTSVGEGFITHADQEKSGLTFNIVNSDNNGATVVVNGPPEAVQAWSDRQGGRVVDTAQPPAAQPAPAIAPVSQAPVATPQVPVDAIPQTPSASAPSVIAPVSQAPVAIPQVPVQPAPAIAPAVQPPVDIPQVPVAVQIPAPVVTTVVTESVQQVVYKRSEVEASPIVIVDTKPVQTKMHSIIIKERSYFSSIVTFSYRWFDDTRKKWVRHSVDLMCLTRGNNVKSIAFLNEDGDFETDISNIDVMISTKEIIATLNRLYR